MKQELIKFKKKKILEKIGERELALHNRMPIGASFPWSGKGIVDAPDGWVVCEGQRLVDKDSPFNGHVLPNLDKMEGVTWLMKIK